MARQRPEGFPEGAQLEVGKWYKTPRGKIAKVLKIYQYDAGGPDHKKGWGYANCSDGANRVVAHRWIGASTWNETKSDTDFVCECNEDGSDLITYKQEQLSLF